LNLVLFGTDVVVAVLDQDQPALLQLVEVHLDLHLY
jgi:hypothetical protein